ncbi:hypothetical protein GCM10023093_07940 [Nemorincola caseinilytica]|uniref:Uncharacterized protein n=1 Tax=Nemorincola caseinilytica TaxID=2054315 RepID=A0ABP8N6A7_9BACT
MKLKEGDLFTLRVSDSNYAIGQIRCILNKESLTVVIFKGLQGITSPIDPKEIIKNDVLFFANTFDAKFYHKHWIVFANIQTNLEGIRLPVYKLGTDDMPQYEDFFQNPLPSTAIKSFEKDKISYRNYVAPVRVEKAVKAYYNLEEWNTDYDKLLYKNLFFYSVQ